MTMTKDEVKEIMVPTTFTEKEFLPHYASLHAAGADVKAAIPAPISLHPGTSCLVPTGVKCALPEGYEIQVRPRSGLALKFQITVLNTPGTIDADYRGEICVILINHGKETFIIEPGMRIAQLVVAEVVRGHFIETSTLDETVRGDGGFGSSGY